MIVVLQRSPFQELRERVLRGKYRVPFYMSTDCEGILRRFLVMNPAKRCSLEVRRIFYYLFLFVLVFWCLLSLCFFLISK